jgi:hypothetical protein
VCRGRIEVVVELLDILSVVSLMASYTKETLLQDRILSVPQRQTKAQPLMVVGDPSDTILSPSVSSRPSMGMRKVAPSVTVCGVILSHGSLEATIMSAAIRSNLGTSGRTYPLPIAHVWAPPLPMLFAFIILF